MSGIWRTGRASHRACAALPAEPAVIETVALPQGPVTVQWRRSARARRVTMRIDTRSGGIVLTVPARTGRAAARAAGLSLLTGNAGWVADRLGALPPPVVFADGAMLALAGEPHRIYHMPGGRRGVWLEDGEIRVCGDAAFLQRRVTDWLRAEAKRRLGALVANKCAMAGLSPRRVTIKDTRSRWGSCAPDGTLMFSWRLVMAPELVQDYVVAHEVAHLRHMNHGAQFWGFVGALTPHRQAGTAWLKADGASLLRAG